MSTTAAGIFVLGLTISLSLVRPRIGNFHIHHSNAAVIGALLTLALQILPLSDAAEALELLARPVVTIVSLMVITLVAEQAGLFEILARAIARAAQGNGRKLFAYLFFSGTITGTIFTNDAAVLIFTPLVFNLIEEVQEDDWTLANKIPFYFSVLYVANLVGALVISNPINIIVSSVFGIAFLEYAAWMFVPALVSIFVSFAGIRFVFRKSIPETYRVPDQVTLEPRAIRFIALCAIVLAAVLVGFFTEGFTGIPVWVVALAGAVQLMLLRSALSDIAVGPIVKGVGWDVIVFVIGIFLVARGLQHAGITDNIGELIVDMAGESTIAMSFATGIIAAVSSAVMNNHPTADVMSFVIRDLSLTEMNTRVMVYAALIGGDLGPKMLPIGSLAALLWFGILRSKGVVISYWLYIKIGVPVTSLAILLSLVALNLEVLIYHAFT